MICIEVMTNELIDKMSVHKKTGPTIEYEISTEEQAKISEWLCKILGNGEGIDTMHFPLLRYIYHVTGHIGYMFKVEELLTKNTLDLTDIDLF